MTAQDLIANGIRRGARRLRLLALSEGVFGLALFLGWYLFLEIVADHLFSLSAAVRMALLVVMAASAAAIVIAAVALPVVRSINRLYIARSVEYAFPDFKNSLVTYVQLEKLADDDGAIGLVANQAARRFDGLDVARTLHSSRLVTLAYAFVTLVLVAFFYSIFGPKSMFTSFLRAIRPWQHISAPTRTHILEVVPGDARIEQGKDLAISAKVSGPGDAFVKWSSDGELWQSTAMLAADDGWKGTLSRVDANVSYYVAAGDAASQVYGVVTLLPPVVESVTAVVSCPAYTGLPPRRSSDGNIQAPIGSVANVTVGSNKDLRRVSLRLPGNASADLAVSGKNASGKFTVAESGRYSVLLTDVDGLKPDRPVQYDIVATPDLPPTVAIEGPRDGALEPIDGEIPFRLEAADDYGLAKVVFHFETNAGNADVRNFLPPGRGKTFSSAVTFVPRLLGALADDTLSYYLEAFDNREGRPNSSRTPTYRFKVVDGQSQQAALEKPAASQATPQTPAASQATQTPAPLPGQTGTNPGASAPGAKAPSAASPSTQPPAPKPRSAARDDFMKMLQADKPDWDKIARHIAQTTSRTPNTQAASASTAAKSGPSPSSSPNPTESQSGSQQPSGTSPQGAPQTQPAEANSSKQGQSSQSAAQQQAGGNSEQQGQSSQSAAQAQAGGSSQQQGPSPQGGAQTSEANSQEQGQSSQGASQEQTTGAGSEQQGQSPQSATKAQADSNSQQQSQSSQSAAQAQAGGGSSQQQGQSSQGTPQPQAAGGTSEQQGQSPQGAAQTQTSGSSSQQSGQSSQGTPQPQASGGNAEQQGQSPQGAAQTQTSGSSSQQSGQSSQGTPQPQAGGTSSQQQGQPPQGASQSQAGGGSQQQAPSSQGAMQAQTSGGNSQQQGQPPQGASQAQAGGGSQQQAPSSQGAMQAQTSGGNSQQQGQSPQGSPQAQAGGGSAQQQGQTSQGATQAQTSGANTQQRGQSPQGTPQAQAGATSPQQQAQSPQGASQTQAGGANSEQQGQSPQGATQAQTTGANPEQQGQSPQGAPQAQAGGTIPHQQGQPPQGSAQAQAGGTISQQQAQPSQGAVLPAASVPTERQGQAALKGGASPTAPSLSQPPASRGGSQAGDKSPGTATASRGGSSVGAVTGGASTPGPRDRSGVPETGRPGEKPPLPQAGSASGEDTAAQIAATRKLVTRLSDDVRANVVDPSLLADLGWKPSQLQTFVRKYEDALRDFDAQPGQGAGDLQATLDSGSVIAGNRAAESVGGVDTGGPAAKKDQAPSLDGIEREDVSPQYRKLVDEYYRSLSQPQ